MGEVLTYKFGQKNNWRNRCWNEIRAGIKNPAEAKVLYLCGPEDLDREVAVRKGFKEKNLFAVSNDKKVVAALRAKKRNVIYGDILEVVQVESECWDVVHLDLCGGFSVSTASAIFAIEALRVGGVLVANFQRGRESSLKAIRERVERAVEWIKIKMEEDNIPCNWLCEDAKHRGQMLVFEIFSFYFDYLPKRFGFYDEIRKHFNGKISIGFHAAFPTLFLSYKSNRVQMDSVILHKKEDFPACLKGPHKAEKVLKMKTTMRDDGGIKLQKIPAHALRQQIAAVKATSTRRYGK